MSKKGTHWFYNDFFFFSENPILNRRNRVEFWTFRLYPKAPFIQDEKLYNREYLISNCLFFFFFAFPLNYFGLDNLSHHQSTLDLSFSSFKPANFIWISTISIYLFFGFLPLFTFTYIPFFYTISLPLIFPILNMLDLHQFILSHFSLYSLFQCYTSYIHVSYFVFLRHFTCFITTFITRLFLYIRRCTFFY